MPPKKPVKRPLIDPRVSRVNSMDFGSIITVVVGVGSEQKIFMVHRHRLVERSAFFNKALSGAWAESTKQIVRLPADDPAYFQLYVDLLYTGQVTVILKSRSTDNADAAKSEQNALAKLYILADKLQDVRAKNRTIAALLASLNEASYDDSTHGPGASDLSIIYENTPPGSLLRKVMVELFTSKATASWVTTDKQFPEDFVRELLLNITEKRETEFCWLDTRDITSYMEREDT